MSNVSDPGEGYRYCELITERWQASFKAPYYESIGRGCEVTVEGLIKFERDLSVVIRPEVGSVLSTLNLVGVDEVEVRGKDCKA